MFEVYLKKTDNTPYYPCDKYTVYSVMTDENGNVCFLVYMKKSGWTWEFAENFIPKEVGRA